MYRIENAPEKGKGMVAARYIPLGTLILSENPLFCPPLDVEPTTSMVSREVLMLSQHERGAYFSLQKDVNIRDPGLSIYKNNTFQLGDAPDAAEEGGVFLDVAKINHSPYFSTPLHPYNCSYPTVTIYPARIHETQFT
jgi:hypothetical protein